jgi:hypothetical protein
MNEAIEHLKKAVAEGKHWYLALLESMGLWTQPEEEYKGQRYHYLINGEAFDWLLLAERLCEEIDGYVSPEEVEELLFQGKPPVELSKEEFRKLIGDAKYKAYLNYFYGITVEEALLLAVEEEVVKEKKCLGFRYEGDITDEVFRRIYGAPQSVLLQQFRCEKGYPPTPELSFREYKEFTYWLFKYRLKGCEKARVASDTKKGLEYLYRLWSKVR